MEAENKRLKERILELEARVLELEDEYEFTTCSRCETKLTKDNTYDWGERDGGIYYDGYCEKCSVLYHKEQES